ncbi:hypothetical protein ABVT39_010063, partial [Epinephelus coioides]
ADLCCRAEEKTLNVSDTSNELKFAITYDANIVFGMQFVVPVDRLSCWFDDSWVDESPENTEASLEHQSVLLPSLLWDHLRVTEACHYKCGLDADCGFDASSDVFCNICNAVV